jgi:uncharacterized membrane protein YfcA
VGWMLYLFIGALAGLIMGTVGVGGGAIIISALLLVAKFPQKIAQGTTLLVIAAPVSLLAAWNYHRNGLVNVKAGLLIMISFLVFSFLGSHLAAVLPREILKNILGVVFVFMGAKILFS